MNSVVGIDLSWTKECVLVGHNNNITGIDFKITSTELYVPAVAFSINSKIKFFENLKQES